MTEGRVGRRVLVVAGAVVVVAAVATLSLGLHRQGEKRDLIARCNQVSAEFEGREYTRDPDTPGFEMLPGNSADAYWEANDLYPKLAKHQSDPLRMMGSPATGWPDAGEGVEPGAADAGPSIPQACVDAGVPDLPDDPVVAALDAGGCLHLRNTRPAVALVEEGSRRAGTRSMFSLWDDRFTFHEDFSGFFSKTLHSYGLVRALYFEAYLAGLRGDHERQVHLWGVALRYGADMMQGAGVMGALAGLSYQDSVARAIESALLADALEQAPLEQLYADLAYVNRHGPDLYALYASEYLTLAAYWLEEDEARLPRGGLLFEEDRPTQWDKATSELDVSGTCVVGDALLALADVEYTDRLEAYAQAPLSETYDSPSLGATYATLDARLTAHHSGMLALQIGVADALYRRENGTAPPSLEALAAAYPDLPVTDPLTGEPFRLVHDGEGRAVISEAVAPELQEALGLQMLTVAPNEETFRIELPDAE